MATAANPYAGFLGANEPFAVIGSTVDRIRELTAGLSAEQLAAPPAPGKWSIYQILGHFADCELMFQTRSRMILFQDKPTLVAFDQDPWVNGWMRENEPWEETFERLTVLRRSSLRLFGSVPEHDLLRYGIHTERGPVTVADTIRTMAGHDINHLQQIERIRAIQAGK
ncbi:MAG TPA: DinB family protein [Bryobacteraceae bacterium]|nr:DinB family protein [Bryobacteraceae bacterium]